MLDHLLGAEGKALISAHIAESAMYGGAIASRGPRYCPSVEDKIVKFPTPSVISSSSSPRATTRRSCTSTDCPRRCPRRAARRAAVRPGLESVAMTRAGYAIEYDYYPPTSSTRRCSCARPRTLFAGQINGTTGYEEAAGQGLVAGANAAGRALGESPLLLGRESSYIGVLVDDLVTRGVDEPYRLFTSRSEFRLTVRQDNALRRLASFGLAMGIYDDVERR
jgi:tRNA uridine 5-carboxymethylaminomethyl modification enzyme